MAVPILQEARKTFTSKKFGGGYNTRDTDLDIDDDELSGGQNLDINPDQSITKRSGHTLYGDFTGVTTGVQGLITHTPQGGTSEFLKGYDTVIQRYVAGVWTALTSVTMTTAKQLDYAYFPLTSKTYIVNGVDNVVKYTSGASGDQTDGSFKKGKYVVHFKNRLLVGNVSTQSDYVWYTDLGVDTFSANNYFRVEGEITGLEVLNDKVLIFTKKKVYVLQNFIFNGAAAGPESVLPLMAEFGAIYDRTIAKIGKNLIVFLGQNSEGLCGVYATDGINVSLISDKIITDLNNLAPAQLASACATQWGRFYRIAVAPSGSSYNTREYLWDSIANRWLPPYVVNFGNNGGISCYATVETSGQLDLYGGSQSDSRVYKLNQVDYDETLDQFLLTGNDNDTAVDANPAKRAAQSFQLSVGAPRTMLVTGVQVFMKKNTGTTTELTVRIETDAAGVPSGTLAHANLTGTIAAFTDTSFVWKTVKFATPAALSASTTYWLVVKHTTEGSGNSQYTWADKTSGGYTGGNGADYVSGAWTAGSRDYLFGVYTEGNINFYADTKAFRHSPIGQLTHLREIETVAKATGDWDIQIGVNTGEYAAFDLQNFNLGSGGPLFGSTLVIGQSVLGGRNRVEGRLRWNGIRGKTIKYRFQNVYDNEPITIYDYRTVYEIINKIK